jgi:glycosyltransferase involved in cell wall biosynthesis
MRVLQAAAKMASLASFALPLMQRLRDDGFEIEALGQFDGFEARLSDDAFITHHWPLGHTTNPWRLWQARRFLRRFLQDRSYDIVHTHCSFGGVVANPVAYPLVRTLIYTQHGFYTHDGLHPAVRRAWLAVERIGLRSAHRVICVGRAERDLALTLNAGDPAKFVQVPGAGVRTQRFRLGAADRTARRQALRESLGIPGDETVLLTLSRLTWDKGYREMIASAQQLCADGRSFRFLAAGSGKDERGIRRAIERAGLGDRFHLLGWRDDVPDLYSAADVFVFASHREGLPIAPVEAMASGLPVVASDIPGCREEIRHEQSGLLFRTGEAGALADALRRILDDRARAQAMGQAAADRARAFDIERVLDLQSALYHEVTHSR